MQPKLHALAFAALAALAVPALAQDQEQAPAPETPDAPATAEAEAAPKDPQTGDAYVAGEHGDWQVRCVKAEEEPDPCQLYQVLTDQKDNAVAEIVIFPVPEGQKAAAAAVVTTPLETLLTEEITIVIDEKEGRRYPFSFCTPQGCVAQIGLTKEDLDTYKKGSEAKLRIVPARAPDQNVILTASLKGFTAGFQALLDDAKP